MDFRLSEETLMVKEMVKKFAKSQVEPMAEKIDKSHEFPMETWNKMRELGLTGFPIPEEWGGVGGSYLDFAIIIEELAKACASTAVITSVHTGLGCMSIYLYGSQRLKEKYLRKLSTGEIIGAYALTEPNAGSDAAALKTRAEDKGDHFLVNGSKIFITNGGHATTYCTFVKTDPSQPKGKGITCLIIEKDTPGFAIGKPVAKMGMNADPTCELYFENVKVPKENVLGEVNNGFSVAMGLLTGGRITIGAQGLGIAEGALDYTNHYIKERQQFDKPLAANQGVQFMMADMATKIDAAQMLVYRAAWLKDNHLPHNKEASMAKFFATDTAMEVTTNCVQLMGGYGYCSEFPVERMMRDAKITQIYEGSNQIQRMIIGREVIGRF
ncbi:acyl-CoA dehydrogenase family protein [Desulfosporosinus hippei]|uniref:Butyryl-CoA dehydrogenase n=1 Tax=Desulfosporosinus hippei DSM 8344 TaxID=1121419 RepID=A0A1G8F9S9_9FIRM|nr:acyl-CoA dehydrogenase family protein [Desulfosporosinus hippei]SDH78855.1 butyryl-CoA dehydrogenase [Desulfosporosinus hippei DSM 8344]